MSAAALDAQYADPPAYDLVADGHGQRFDRSEFLYAALMQSTSNGYIER
jgi:hypothetical protein